MGEAARKRRAHRDKLVSYPHCIYCGATAETIEHMPPTVIFRRKDRPKGLEFPSCKQCNNGTSHSDLVAATLGRAYPPDPNDHQGHPQPLRGHPNNIPDLLLEMQVSPIRQSQTLRRMGWPRRTASYA